MTSVGSGWYVREEADSARLDRNFAELLQELRLVQTGVQILFGFLLALAFQQRFATVTTLERVLYLVALVSAVCASILFMAPAAVHRVLFRRNVKDEIVEMTVGLAKAGMACLAVAMLTGVTFVVTFVGGLALGLVLGGLLATLMTATWVVLPGRKCRRRPVRSSSASTAPGYASPIQLAKG